MYLLFLCVFGYAYGSAYIGDPVSLQYEMVEMVELPDGCTSMSPYCYSMQWFGDQTHGVFNADLNSSRYTIAGIDFEFYDNSDGGHTSTFDNLSCDLFRSASDLDVLMDCSAQSGSGWVRRSVPPEKLALFKDLAAPQKIQVTSTVYGGDNGCPFYNPFSSEYNFVGYKWKLQVLVHPVCRGCGSEACLENVPCTCQEGAAGDFCRSQTCTLDGFAENVGITSCTGPNTDDFGPNARGSSCVTSFNCPTNYNVVGTPGASITCGDCSGGDCPPSWSTDPASVGFCDPNECALGTHNCHAEATCTDFVGGFSCACNAGFTGDGVTCELNECEAPVLADGITRSCTGPLVSRLGPNTENATCVIQDNCDSLGSFVLVGSLPTIECHVETLEFDDVGTVYCEEDKCVSGTHDCSEYAACDYVVGGFVCTCFDLYHGSGQVCEVEMCPTLTPNAGTSIDCSGPLNDEHGISVALSNCTIVNECPEHHYYLEPAGTPDFACERDESVACVSGGDIGQCSPTWTTPLADLPYCDPDECILGTHTCHADAMCENTATSYTCTCLDGHVGDGELCEDIDECADDGLNLCHPEAECRNLHGSYECECVREGYTDPEGLGHMCYDVNECEDEDVDDGCVRDSTCVNVDGGQNLCICNEGYEGDGFTGCTDINECETGANNCSEVGSVCINKAGRHECACVAGFVSVSDVVGEECVDVNECLNDADNACSSTQQGGICTNTVGSYECTCRDGYRLKESWGTTCVDVDECKDGTAVCADHATCVNVVGAPYMCTCNEGYTGDGVNSCTDVDECASSDNACDPDNAVCTNTDGSYKCDCVDGFVDGAETKGEVCTDVDECAVASDNACSGAEDGGFCTNTVGSYVCGCVEGYRLEGTTCVDINECAEVGRSVLCHESAQCVNLPGSHRCTCLDGQLGNGIQVCIDPSVVETQQAAVVEVNMDMACADFVADNFIDSLATFLDVSPKRITLVRIRCASVHAQVALLGPQVVSASELRANDRISTEDLVALAVDELAANKSSSFKEEYSVVSSSYSGGMADVVVDKTKQQAYAAPVEQGKGDSGADATISESESSSSTMVIVGVVMMVLFIVGGVAYLVSRRRSNTSTGIGQVEMDDRAYQSPDSPQSDTSTRTAGTLASLVSMRRDKTLKASSAGVSAGYDKAPCVSSTTSARVPASFLEGKVLIPSDELERETKIGEGAFGLVFKGKWGEKAVAIKEVKGTNTEAIKQLVDEGERLSQIPPHANVVTFFGVCADPMGVVLQFCAKGALLDKLYGTDPSKFHEFSLAELQALVLGIAAGLKHLHSVQVIHRDVATRNVLIDESGAPKLTDFGMSRDQEEGADYVQQTKTGTGPLKWMAPEQMVDRIVSSKADMYSFGIVLWEMYARSEPWPGVAALQAAGNVMAGKQHAIAGDATPMAAAIMLACFDKDPHARPSAERVVKGGVAVWGADGSNVDGVAVGGNAKENADVLKLKKTHFAELPKEEDDAVYVAPPTSATQQAKKGAADLTKSSSSHRRGKKSGGGRTPRTPRADAN